MCTHSNDYVLENSDGVIDMLLLVATEEYCCGFAHNYSPLHDSEVTTSMLGSGGSGENNTVCELLSSACSEHMWDVDVHRQFGI